MECLMGGFQFISTRELAYKSIQNNQNTPQYMLIRTYLGSKNT